MPSRRVLAALDPAPPPPPTGTPVPARPAPAVRCPALRIARKVPGDTAPPGPHWPTRTPADPHGHIPQVDRLPPAPVTPQTSPHPATQLPCPPHTHTNADTTHPPPPGHAATPRGYASSRQPDRPRSATPRPAGPCHLGPAGTLSPGRSPDRGFP